MNIGIMCHSSLGGSARIATELAAELALRGHRIHLFSRTTPFGLQGEPTGVVLHRSIPDRENTIHPSTLYTEWPEKEVQSFLFNVRNVIVKEGLDLIHFHYAVPFAFIAKRLKKILGEDCPRMVGTLHGTDVSEYGRDPFIGPALSETLRELDGLTTVSANYSYLAKNIFKLTNYPEIIPNFVSFIRKNLHSSYDEHEKVCLTIENLGQPKIKKEKGRPVIIHLSNFRPVKDLQGVLRIFLGIRDKLDAELWLVGDGQEMAKLKSVFEQSRFKSDIRCWGLQDEVAPILFQTDLLLMSSHKESFGLCALEAMACGVPVLATHVGGLPELVVHEKTGFLFPVNHHAAAVDYAVSLLTDPLKHRSMRRAALNQARNFRKEAIVPLYEDFYSEVLNKERDRLPYKWGHGYPGE